jgi:hypothetical protein
MTPLSTRFAPPAREDPPTAPWTSPAGLLTGRQLESHSYVLGNLRRFSQLENQIPELQGEIDFLKIKFLSSDQVLNDAKSFYARWPDLDFASKQQLIETIVEKITIGKDDVAIDLCYLPSSPQDVTHKQRSFTGSLRPRA